MDGHGFTSTVLIAIPKLNPTRNTMPGASFQYGSDSTDSNITSKQYIFDWVAFILLPPSR